MGFFLSCRGYPTCKTSVWLPEAVIDASVLNEECQNCLPRKVNKIKFKFDKKSVPFTLASNYTACIICNPELKEHLHIDTAILQVPVTRQSNTGMNMRAGSQSVMLTNTAKNTNIIHNSVRAINSSISPPGVLSSNSNQNRNFSSNTNFNTINSNRNNDTNSTVCYCGKPASLLTARKEGVNQGRKFYSCPDNKTCDFFMWHDENETVGRDGGGGGDGGGNNGDGGSGHFGRSNHSFQPNNSLNQSLNTVTCTCGMPAVQLTVKKEGPNQGKHFRSCSQKKCNFFEWIESKDGSQNISSNGGKKNPAVKKAASTFEIKKKTRCCSVCNKEGHNKNNCPENQDDEEDN